MAEQDRMLRARIGVAGELFAQAALLNEAVVASRPAVDAGVDLVALWDGKVATIQVKTTKDYVPAGGMGKPLAQWVLKEDRPVDFMIFVLLSEWQFWVMTWEDAMKMRAQRIESGPLKGQLTFLFYKEPDVGAKEPKRLREAWVPFEGKRGIVKMKRAIKT